MFKLNRKRSTALHKLEKMRKRAEAAHRAKVSTGINAGEGMHSNGLKYADLMAIHHNGVPSKGIPPRPVLSIVTRLYGKLIAKKAKHEMFKYLDGQQSLDHTLTSIGKVSLSYTHKVFGDPTVLPQNAKTTIRIKGKDAPLVDSGELQSKLSYSYSWKGGEHKGYETM
ncbi:hypothetical protein [Salinivibrio costicola]|uniref:hypothetical protein n=1 Tax=Salinivibrio costicola TaxID=51367 RepID=UPI000395BDAA|nr:hypothetical protein [Salinivibrio costicola]